MKTFTQTKYALPAIILAMMITAFAFFAFTNSVRPVTASIGTFDSYNATTTRSTEASATYSSVVCKDNCQLGSVIITQPASGGYLRIWNATSTATSTYTDIQASTTAAITWGKALAKFDSGSDVVGTYVFDTIMTNGVVIEASTGFNGEYVVTWKR